MSIRRAKKICDLQNRKLEVIIECPYCDNLAKLNLATEKWVCKTGHKGTEEELLELAQKDWEDKHRSTIKLMRNYKGVCG